MGVHKTWSRRHNSQVSWHRYVLWHQALDFQLVDSYHCSFYFRDNCLVYIFQTDMLSLRRLAQR